MPRTLWRVAPPPGIAHRVKQIAADEHRSIANAITVLVGEAIDARARAAKKPSEEMRRFAELLSQAISPKPDEP